MKTLLQTALLSMSFLLTACGGGSSGSGNSSVNDNDDLSGNSDGVSGTYDLAEYYFHSHLDSLGAVFSYKTRLYLQSTGEEYLPNNVPTEEYIKQSESTVLLKPSNLSVVTSIFEINPTKINVTVNTTNPPAVEVHSRNISVGEVFLDQIDQINGDERHAKCEVVMHLSSFNLANATGSYALASGVYSDVLHIYCAHTNTGATSTDFNLYYAKDYGLIFWEGNVSSLAELYFIPEF